ncbi:MAG: alpha/beta hydrolase [Pseudomonadota bacterium]
MSLSKNAVRHLRREGYQCIGEIRSNRDTKPVLNLTNTFWLRVAFSTRFHVLPLFMITILVGCAARGDLDTAPAVENATIREVYVAQFRQESGQIQSFGERRPNHLSFQRLDVSVPPSHEVGQIEWPHGSPNAETDFVVVGRQSYPDLRSFARAVANSDQSSEQETVIHVHGYNTTHGEAVYSAAQVAFDMDIPVPLVLFSWPSAAQTSGYIYDRDSALISRDMLQQLIVAFATQSSRKVFLTGHSMGGYLLMETLRQIAIEGDLDLKKNINGVMLLSPDIDTELFREQAKRIGSLPDPFLILVAGQDRALKISSLLTGREVRLGSLTNPEELEGLAVTLVDVGSLSDGQRFEHNIATTSPAAIAILRSLSDVASPGDLHIVDSIVRADQAEGLLSRLPLGQ